MGDFDYFTSWKAPKFGKLGVWLLDKNGATITLKSLAKKPIYHGLLLWSFGNTEEEFSQMLKEWLVPVVVYIWFDFNLSIWDNVEHHHFSDL